MSAYLQASSVVTAIGLNTEQTTAVAMTGMSAAQQSGVNNKQFQPMTLAILPDEVLPPLVDTLSELTPALSSRQTRMLRLSALALQDLQQQHAVPEGLPLLLAVAEAGLDGRTPAAPPVPGNFVALLEAQNGLALDQANSRILPYGRAAGLLALQQAGQLFEQGHDHVLVGGLDSHFDLMLLAVLDQQDRVKAEGISDGFIPGEGAAFLLLSKQPCALPAANNQPMAGHIAIPGLFAEPGHRYSDQPYRGDGLAAAVRQVTTGQSAPIETVWNSFNGENMMAKEWGVAFIRNKPAFNEAHALYHPAEGFGDIGAAFGPALVAMSIQAMLTQQAQGPSLCFCASELEGRGAVITQLQAMAPV